MPSVRWVVLGSLAVSFAGVSAAEAAPEEGKPRPRGAQIFYRMTASQKNAPVLPKTRSVWTQDRRTDIGNTGMADEGYTEFPFCYGVMDFTFDENWGIYPRLVSGAQADESRVNTADLLIDHIYEPQASVWGWNAREFLQTFTATEHELVRIVLRTDRQEGLLQAALLEGGPGGRQIGPVRTFAAQSSPAGGWAGSTEYATTRWEPGQAPLVPGQTYGIRIWRPDGKAWLPYLHATGDAYDGGLLHVDGVSHPESDLALWISQETKDLKRALVVNADEDGWVYNTREVFFVPRTPNVRMITLNLSPVAMDPPTEHNCCDIVVRIWNMQGKEIVGPKQGLACGAVGSGNHIAQFLYGTDELLVSVGEQYRLDAYLIPHRGQTKPNDQVTIEPRDMNARIYGEPEPGALPSIFNLAVEFTSDSVARFTWSAPFPAATELRTWGLGDSGDKVFRVPAGQTELIIPKLWAGHWYDYQLTSTGPTGLTWTTPVYRLRMPKPSENIIAESQASYMKHLLALVPAKLVEAPKYAPLRYRGEVDLVNGDFEEGMKGWSASPAGRLDVADVGWTAKSKEKELGLGTEWGDRMGGFTHVAASDRHEVREKSLLTQEIATKPGHVYVMSANVNTSVVGGAAGDTRVRLFAVAAGASGLDEIGPHSSQWYWTDGEWMRFQHQWRADTDRSVVGFGFFRRLDLDRSSAYVDSIQVYDLGPVSQTVNDAPALAEQVARIVLADRREEANDKVECYLQAPPKYVITGLGARAHADNITTMWMRVQPLLPDGQLGEPEEIRGGWEPGVGLESKIELPPGYVATGFGAGIAPEWDVKRMGVWARPLNPDGSLGEEKLYRGGSDLKSGFEKEVRLEPGRVLTSAGLNCMFNDVNGIKASSSKLMLSASGEARTGR
jgi:hypothetical protein